MPHQENDPKLTCNNRPEPVHARKVLKNTQTEINQNMNQPFPVY